MSGFPRARGVVQNEPFNHQQKKRPGNVFTKDGNNGYISPPVGRSSNGLGHNDYLSSSSSTSKNDGSSNGGSNGALPRRSVVNGGHSLAYTYAPLEHSSNLFDSWQQIPKGLTEVVLGDAGSLSDVVKHGGEGGGGGGTSHHSKTYRLAVKRTVVSVVMSCCFGLATMVFRGKQSGLEFFAGYLVEQSLSEFGSQQPGDASLYTRMVVQARFN